jgi:hypothetical protein
MPWQCDVAGATHWEKELSVLKIKKMQLIIFKADDIKRPEDRAFSFINKDYIKITFH